MKHKKGGEKTKSAKPHERPQLHRSLNVKLSPGKSKGLLSQLQDKLKGSKFRWINEKLYTQSGNDSLEMIQKDTSLFDLYHEGFREQVTRWPLVPVDVFIRMLKKLQRQKVGDFGCGDGKIYKECPNQDIFSFDLVSKEDFITACDIAHVPLEDGFLDIGIFCLALMGTNWSEFIAESNRCLHEGGQLWIAEVRSRFESESIGGEQGFIRNIEKLGFKLYRKNTENTHFGLFFFKKIRGVNRQKTASIPSLKPCVYKRR